MRQTSLGLLCALLFNALAIPAEEGWGEERERVFRFPREQRDIELREIAPRLGFGFQTEAFANEERWGDENLREAAIDEFEWELEYAFSENVEWQIAVVHEFGSSDKVLLEEAVARIGLDENSPWFTEFGRMELPFGEFNSNFVEDPSTVELGEMYDEGVSFGFETETFETTATVSRGIFDGEDLLVMGSYAASEKLELGVYFASNISESLAIRETLKESIAEGGVAQAVPASGFYLAWDLNPFLLDLEYIEAHERFDADLLDDEDRRPRAWNLEVAVNPVPAWMFAVRIERSHDLPESPHLQYGFAASYGILENLILTANVLNGDFEEDHTSRKLWQMELVYEF